MRINFFEEYPRTDPETMKKAGLIDFPSTIYIAASSLEEFDFLRKELNSTNSNIDAAYWPILKDSYWISPFSYKKELEDLIHDFENISENFKTLIDIELPFIRPISFYENFFYNFKEGISTYFGNIKLIKKIFRQLNEKNADILVAEWSPSNFLLQKILESIGLTYSTKKFPHKKIKMFYSSMFSDKKYAEEMKKHLSSFPAKYGKNIEIGLGAIAKGVYNERILSSQELELDLDFAKNSGFETANIYRLGGLNDDYLKVIKKYV